MYTKQEQHKKQKNRKNNSPNTSYYSNELTKMNYDHCHCHLLTWVNLLLLNMTLFIVVARYAPKLSLHFRPNVCFFLSSFPLNNLLESCFLISRHSFSNFITLLLIFSNSPLTFSSSSSSVDFDLS